METFMWRLIRVAMIAMSVGVWVILAGWLFSWSLTTCLITAVPLVAFCDLLVERLKG